MTSRVLVVDDDAEMAETVADYLSSQGYKADVAVGGKQAVAAIKKR